MDFSFLLSNGPQLTNGIGRFLNVLCQHIGSVGWTIVVFTLIIKLITLPLDIWQRIASRKQSKAMKRIQPQLAKLQTQYATRPDIFRLEQRKLFKKEGVSFLSTIVPMLVTMIIFFVMFSGFNAFVKYKNEETVFNLYKTWEGVVDKSTWAEVGKTAYKPEKWLWVDNVFMPDTWAWSIPDLDVYAKRGLGKLNATTNFLTGVNYNDLVKPARAHYGKWNGYLILPILSIALSIVSTIFLQKLQPTPPTAHTGDKEKDAAMQASQEKSAKFMKFLMPAMMGVFSLFYSATFSIYIFVSSLFSTFLSLIFIIVFKNLDKKEEDMRLSTTFEK